MTNLLKVSELHQKISLKEQIEQYFIQAPTKKLTKKTKGDIKFSDNLYGKHPRGRKYDSSHGRK
jgi:hypothetical protein